MRNTQDDLTLDDWKVQPTDNGWHTGDGPQPAQLVQVPRLLQAGAANPIDTVLAIAASQIGTVADRNGCQKYGAAYGMNCVSWCAEFVWWVFQQAGFGGLIPKTAYTPTFYNWFVNHHQDPNDIRRGDIVFYDWPNDGVNRISHVGIVEKVLSSTQIQTIEGNTTPPSGTGDQSHGGGVWRRTRSMGPVVGWGRPAYGSVAPAPVPVPAFDPNSLPTLQYGMTSSHVALFQKASNAAPWSPVLPLLPITGYYGDKTADVVRRAQAQRGITGPDANGRIIGPRSKAAFAAFGLRW